MSHWLKVLLLLCRLCLTIYVKVTVNLQGQSLQIFVVAPDIAKTSFNNCQILGKNYFREELINNQRRLIPIKVFSHLWIFRSISSPGLNYKHTYLVHTESCAVLSRLGC